MGLTRIDVLEANIAHFSKPDAKFSISSDSARCMYRADKTPNCPQRCGIGVVITEELYDSSIEGEGVVYLLDNHDDLRDLFDPECFVKRTNDGTHDMTFLEVIQDLHDTHAVTDHVTDLVEDLKDLLTLEKNGESEFV